MENHITPEIALGSKFKIMFATKLDLGLYGNVFKNT